MSWPEVAYRTGRAVTVRLQQAGLGGATCVPTMDSRTESAPWIHADARFDAGQYAAAADRILCGTWDVFALSGTQLGHPPAWNRDPKSGTTAPLVFGKTLDYRDPATVGDIKYLWEPNRHLHLVTLAQGYRLTGEERYLHGLFEQLDSWLRECPYPLGPNWTSSLELGIRLINWSIAWQLVGGWDSPLFAGQSGERFRQEWLDAIYRHAHFIQGHFSRHSSANNHLIGEAAGLFVATVTWPYWSDFAKWRALAQGELEREAIRQNAGDGVNREQAIAYQQFVLDFLLISALCGRANWIGFSAGFWTVIERMLEYLASIMDVGGNLPMIGDADDGYVVRLAPMSDPYRSLLASGAALFGRDDFKAKAPVFDDKSRWLLGAKGEGDFDALQTAAPPLRRRFSEGGYYLLGRNLDTPREVRLLADAGPLGYLGIAAHGHADALAMWLAIGGREFLVDPGTYAYHTQKKWRDYFRGTSAHNTVRVDGQDQSEIGGNFMWLQKANAWCETFEESEDTVRFVGTHDGYRRLADPLFHRREIVLDKRDRRILVKDRFECRASHQVEWFWHFAEQCRVRCDPESSRITAVNGGITLTIDSAAPEIDCRYYYGDETLPAGWISRRFDVKTPAATAVWRGTVPGAVTEFVTTMRYEFPGEPAAIESSSKK